MVLHPRNGSYRTMGENLALTADSELIHSDDLRGYWKCEVLLYLSGYPTYQELGAESGRYQHGLDLTPPARNHSIARRSDIPQSFFPLILH